MYQTILLCVTNSRILCFFNKMLESPKNAIKSALGFFASERPQLNHRIKSSDHATWEVRGGFCPSPFHTAG